MSDNTTPQKEAGTPAAPAPATAPPRKYPYKNLNQEILRYFKKAHFSRSRASLAQFKKEFKSKVFHVIYADCNVGGLCNLPTGAQFLESSNKAQEEFYDALYKIFCHESVLVPAIDLGELIDKAKDSARTRELEFKRRETKLKSLLAKKQKLQLKQSLEKEVQNKVLSVASSQGGEEADAQFESQIPTSPTAKKNTVTEKPAEEELSDEDKKLMEQVSEEKIQKFIDSFKQQEQLAFDELKAKCENVTYEYCDIPVRVKQTIVMAMRSKDEKDVIPASFYTIIFDFFKQQQVEEEEDNLKEAEAKQEYSMKRSKPLTQRELAHVQQAALDLIAIKFELMDEKNQKPFMLKCLNMLKSSNTDYTVTCGLKLINSVARFNMRLASVFIPTNMHSFLLKKIESLSNANKVNSSSTMSSENSSDAPSVKSTESDKLYKQCIQMLITLINSNNLYKFKDADRSTISKFIIENVIDFSSITFFDDEHNNNTKNNNNSVTTTIKNNNSSSFSIVRMNQLLHALTAFSEQVSLASYYYKLVPYALKALKFASQGAYKFLISMPSDIYSYIAKHVSMQEIAMTLVDYGINVVLLVFQYSKMNKIMSNESIELMTSNNEPYHNCFATMNNGDDEENDEEDSEIYTDFYSSLAADFERSNNSINSSNFGSSPYFSSSSASSRDCGDTFYDESAFEELDEEKNAAMQANAAAASNNKVYEEKLTLREQAIAAKQKENHLKNIFKLVNRYVSLYKNEDVMQQEKQYQNPFEMSGFNFLGDGGSTVNKKNRVQTKESEEFKNVINQLIQIKIQKRLSKGLIAPALVYAIYHFGFSIGNELGMQTFPMCNTMRLLTNTTTPYELKDIICRYLKEISFAGYSKNVTSELLFAAFSTSLRLSNSLHEQAYGYLGPKGSMNTINKFIDSQVVGYANCESQMARYAKFVTAVQPSEHITKMFEYTKAKQFTNVVIITTQSFSF